MSENKTYSKKILSDIRAIEEGKLNRSKGQIKRCRDFMKSVAGSKDAYLLGFANYYLGDAYYNFGRKSDKFADYVRVALPYLERCENHILIARSYNLLGINAVNHGNYQLGLDYFINGLAEIGEEDTRLSGMFSFNIGQIYEQLGDLKTSLKYTRRANRLIREAGIEENLYVYLYTIASEGIINRKLGRLSSAARCYKSMMNTVSKYDCGKFIREDLFIMSFLILLYCDLDMPDEYAEALLFFIRRVTHQTFPADQMTEVIEIFEHLYQNEAYVLADRLAEAVESNIHPISIPFIRMSYAKALIEYYTKKGDEKKRIDALSVYYESSKAHEKELNAGYAVALSLRQEMENMRKENKRLAKAAGTDALTGLCNRFALNENMDEAFERACRDNISLGLEILDVDFFKEYNDTYGHQAGDECLKTISSVIREICEADPDRISAGRYGGDEFVLLYLGMSDDEIMAAAETMRSRIFDMKLINKSSMTGDRVTISQGIRNSVPVKGNKVWDYLYAADNALYDVKRRKKGEIALLHKAAISDKSLAEATHSKKRDM